jgi:hypothetical protein
MLILVFFRNNSGVSLAKLVQKSEWVYIAWENDECRLTSSCLLLPQRTECSELPYVLLTL